MKASRTKRTRPPSASASRRKTRARKNGPAASALRRHKPALQFLQKLPWFGDTHQLLEALERLLIRDFGFNRCRIALLDDTGGRFLFCRAFPRPSDDRSGIEDDSPLVSFFRQSHDAHLSAKEAAPSPEAKEALPILRDLKCDLCLPFVANETVLGLLLLGRPAGAKPLGDEDLSSLHFLVRNVGMVLDRVFLSDELALIGRISRGMAHDLQSLLTPVSLFLQLWQEGTPPKGKIDVLLPVAMRNLKAIQTFIRQTLVFSQRQQPLFRPEKIGLLARRAVELAESEIKQKKVGVVIDVPNGLQADVDEFLFLRLLANLVSNAVKVSPQGGEVRIEADEAADRTAGRRTVRIRVIDSGPGFTQSEWERIFLRPYRRKEKADAESGYGLGLAICRKIVRLHRGRLDLRLPSDGKTCIQIDLPRED